MKIQNAELLYSLNLQTLLLGSKPNDSMSLYLETSVYYTLVVYLANICLKQYNVHNGN